MLSTTTKATVEATATSSSIAMIAISVVHFTEDWNCWDPELCNSILAHQQLRIQRVEGDLCLAGDVLQERVVVLVKTGQDIWHKVMTSWGFPAAAISSAKPFILL
jgi:hypothetical protein